MLYFQEAVEHSVFDVEDTERAIYLYTVRTPFMLDHIQKILFGCERKLGVTHGLALRLATEVCNTQLLASHVKDHFALFNPDKYVVFRIFQGFCG